MLSLTPHRLPEMRDFTGTLPFSYHFGKPEIFSTPLAVDEEVWLGFHKYSEIQSEGVKLIKIRNKNITKQADAVKIWKKHPKNQQGYC